MVKGISPSGVHLVTTDDYKWLFRDGKLVDEGQHVDVEKAMKVDFNEVHLTGDAAVTFASEVEASKHVTATQIENLLASGKQQTFDTGFYNSFMYDFIAYARININDIVQWFYDHADDFGKFKGEPLESAIAMLGDDYDMGAESHELRRLLLEKLLSDADSHVRDAAINGIGHMMDIKSYDALKDAYKAETKYWLRQDIQQLIDWFDKHGSAA